MGELDDRVVGVQDDQLQGWHLVQGGDALDAGQHHGRHGLRLILVNMPFLPSSSPPSSSGGRIEIGTRAAVAPSGAPKYLYVTPTRPPFLLPALRRSVRRSSR